MRNGLALVLFLLFAIDISAQEDVKFSYDTHPVLTWDDFKAEPVLNTPYHANTNSGFSYSWSYSKKNGKILFEYEVYSTFYPNRSWVQPNHKDKYLLAHEQLHFDISELHARKLRKAMENYRPGRNIRRELKRLYNTIEAKRVAMQNRFDAESAHSINKEKEIEWQKFIAKELAILNEYAKEK